ncbi:HvfC/BufC N-terminal domain-containing protein [Pseudoalteromonas maricaloris]|uniref:HvfC/BufC N-terminal domain-containing protein n=1 Tax=Pseudoalteromonas maricaloris TaxID=184924 RepID=UPI00029A2F62|nr:DNA-binding domain-containing protein [Pseudoalteromonas flavipulchra]
MADLAALQHAFIAMLKGDDSQLMAEIEYQSGLNVAQRAQIYTNAYHIRLKKVLEQDHEMLGFYLGDALFDEMFSGYLEHFPSCSTSLRQFGDSLPEYLSQFEPFKLYPILTEIAQFERTLLSAFDAEDAPQLGLVHLQKIAAAQFPNLQFTFHPSVHLLGFTHNAVDSWQALKNSTPVPEVSTKPNYWILARERDMRTGYHSLTEAEFACLQSMKNALPFSFVCEYAAEQSDDLAQGTAMVMQLLQKGLNLGWFSGFKVAIFNKSA